MSKQSEDILEREAEAEGPGSEGMELPDESDSIIEDLKAQLKSLQGQLTAQQEGGSDSPQSAQAGGAEPPTTGRNAIAAWNAAFAPQIAARLQTPTEELTARLDRLIVQVQDPQMRKELEHCQQTAFYLFDTFRKISENHRALIDSLAEEEAVLEPAIFRKALAAEMSAFGTGIAITGNVPPMVGAIPQSILTVVKTLARVAGQLMGEVKTLHLDSGPSDGSREVLCLTIACGGGVDGLVNVESPSQMIFKPGVSAVTVVDWLYMEKIVELKGGSLTLHHEAGRAAGVRIVIPGAPVDVTD